MITEIWCNTQMVEIKTLTIGEIQRSTEIETYRTQEYGGIQRTETELLNSENWWNTRYFCNNLRQGKMADYSHP